MFMEVYDNLFEGYIFNLTCFIMYLVLQKLTTCQQYSHKLALSKLSWNADFPRYQPRYIMQRNHLTLVLSQV